MTRCLRDERGTAMVIAIMVVLIMTALALGTFTFVEGQQRASADERVRDSSYNLSEAGLESAVAYLTVKWPTSAQPWGYNATLTSGGECTRTSASTDNCPDPSSVTTGFNDSVNQQDYAGTPTWTTTVLDNGSPAGPCTSLNLSGSCFYSESLTCVPAGTPAVCSKPKYDVNGDGAVWVRSQATVQGRKRILVALVKAQTTPLPYPRYAMFGGDLAINAALNGKVVDAQGSAGTSGKIYLSCLNPAATPQYSGGACPGADPIKQQVQPWNITTTVTSGFNPCITEAGVTLTGQAPCLSANQGADIIALRQRAQKLGTYYSSCPTAAQLTGPDVFIEAGSVVCNYTTGTNTWNSAANPGMIVVNGGTSLGGCLTIGGVNSTYYGLIYDANEPGFTNGVLISGSAQVIGAVIVDHGDGLFITSTHVPAFTYDPKAFNAATTGTGPIRIIPGTYREVPPSS
jgi:Tfp pilus assembly protein PilX